MHYNMLRKLARNWEGKVCLFAAGLIGSTWAYDLLKQIGFQIDFYCDNSKKANELIRDNIKTISLETLYSYRESVFVFITAAKRYQEDIAKQLKRNGISRFMCVDSFFLQQFIDSLLKINDLQLMKQFKCILDDREFISGQFKYYLGYQPDLDNPKTFNEKLQWIKLYDRNPKYSKMVDKYEVKQIVSDLIGEDYIIPTLGVYNSFDEIEFDELPKQFVMKCTHDSGSIVICRNREDFDCVKAKETLEQGLKRNYYWTGNREWPYKDVKPRIIVEKHMVDDETDKLIDYKFYCFHGKPRFLYVSEGLEDHTTAQISFYNLDLSVADFQRNDFRHFDRTPKMPTLYKEMLNVATILSQEIAFVRVDLYEINKKIYFSEYTFTPCGGFMPFEPEKWDLILGEQLRLPIKVEVGI